MESNKREAITGNNATIQTDGLLSFNNYDWSIQLNGAELSFINIGLSTTILEEKSGTEEMYIHIANVEGEDKIEILKQPYYSRFL